MYRNAARGGPCHDLGNMHKNGEDRTCSSGDIFADRHINADRHTNHNTVNMQLIQAIKTINEWIKP